MNNPNSPNASTYQSESAHEPQSNDQRPVWVFSLLFLLSLIAFLLFTGRKEIARWYVASARNAIQDERYEEAVSAANNGLKWNPDYTDLFEIRAMANLKLKNYEACLEDYDRMLEVAASDGVENEADMGPRMTKASVLQLMNRYDDAIAVWDEIVKYRKEQYRLRDDSESQYAYALSLNNRAYTEAQAWTLEEDSVDIKESLDDIQLAMEIRGDVDDPVMIDTLGYLMLLNGDHEEALQQLELAVELTEKENEALKTRFLNEMQHVVDQRPYQDALERIDQQFSVILHHRGEAYAALGEEEKADADIAKAIELGFNPDEGIW